MPFHSNLITNTKELRNFNKNRIIELVRAQGEMTKSKISRTLNLSFSTVSNNCNELEEEGILVPIFNNIISGGRPSELFTLDSLSRMSFCIDFTGFPNLRIALTNLHNRLVNQRILNLDVSLSIQDVITDCNEIFINLLKKANIEKKRILGASVIIPGIYDLQRECVVNSTIPILENCAIKFMVEKKMGLPVCVENDANLAALAASMDGGKQKYKNVIFIYIGEGLGIGITMKGSIFHGTRGFAGEIEHIPLGDPNYECYCGNRGCVEGILSNSGIQKEFAGVKSKQDRKNVLIKFGRIAGNLFSIFANLFDPEVMFIGGDRESVIQEFLPYTNREVNKKVLFQQFRDIQVKDASNVHDLFFNGASELLIQHWLTN